MEERNVKCIVVGRTESYNDEFEYLNLQQIEAGKQLAKSEGWKEEDIVVCRTGEDFSEVKELLDKRVGYVADVYIVDLPRITTDYKVVEQLIEEVNEVRPIRFVVSGDDFFFESIEVVNEEIYRALFKVVENEDKELVESDETFAYSNEPIRLIEALTHTCSICGCHIEGNDHNAQPINNGRCCSKCNADVVFPARVKYGY